MSTEQSRLAEDWEGEGTLENYSPNGDAWNFFTHDNTLSHAYRWGEEGTSLAFPMTNSTSASRWPYGMGQLSLGKRTRQFRHRTQALVFAPRLAEMVARRVPALGDQRQTESGKRALRNLSTPQHIE